MNKRRGIFFDFDGVIAESYALAYDLAKRRHPHLTMAAHKKMFEGNIFQKSLEMDCGPECDKDYPEGFFDQLLERKSEMTLVPEMNAVVRDCAKTYDLFIVSSTIEEAIYHILQQYDLQGLFEEILGANAHQSKSEKMRRVLEMRSSSAADYVIITDTLGDIREAKEVGVGAVAVSWGFHEISTLKKGDPFRILSSPAELVPAVGEYFASGPRSAS